MQYCVMRWPPLCWYRGWVCHVSLCDILSTYSPQQTTGSHISQHLTHHKQHRAELQCGAAAGCYWLLGWFAVFRVSTVQSVNTGSLHCTALYCTVHMCSVHHTASTQGINPPSPTLQVSNLKSVSMVINWIITPIQKDDCRWQYLCSTLRFLCYCSMSNVLPLYTSVQWHRSWSV